MQSGYACFLLLQNLKVVFAVRRVYVLTAYVVLLRISQEGCEALPQLFLIIAPRCRSFGSSNERYSLAEMVRIFS